MKATMSNTRFKQFFAFRRLQKELQDDEKQLKSVATELAVCSDAINQAKDRKEFLLREIATLHRKTERTEN